MVLLPQDERDRISKENYDAARYIKLENREQILLALGFLNEALTAKPTNVPALVLRASLNAKLNDVVAAIADYSVALQLDQKFDDRRRFASIYCARATLFLNSRRFQEGLMDLAKAVEIEPDNGTWLYEIGKAHLRQGNALFAQQYFQSALQDRLMTKMSEVNKYKTLMFLGGCRLNNGDTSIAAATFARAKDIQESAVVRHLMGLASYQAHNYKDAAEHFQRAAEMNVKNMKFSEHLGICLFRLKDYTNALRSFNSALQGPTRNPEVLFFRAIALMKLERYEHAHEDLNDAIALEPKSKYYYIKGLVCAEEHLYDNAERCFQSALVSHSTFHECFMQLGIIAHITNQLHHAAQYFHQALKLNKSDPVLLERIGLVFADLCYHDSAIRYFEQCRHLVPTNPRMWFRKGVEQLCSGDAYGALDNLKHAIDALGYQEPAAYHARSVAVMRMGDLLESLEWSNRALELDARNHKYLLQRARLHLELKEFDACLRDTHTAIGAFDGCAEVYYIRGRAHHALGNFSAALEDCQRAVALNPDLLSDGSFCYAQGILQALLQQWADALISFTSAIEHSGSGSSVLYFHERAKARHAVGDAEGAVLDFTVVLQRQPNNFHALVRRAFAFKDLGRILECSEDWQHATTLDPSGALALLATPDLYHVSYLELCDPGEEEDDAEQVVH